jgi:hypothetical protein
MVPGNPSEMSAGIADGKAKLENRIALQASLTRVLAGMAVVIVAVLSSSSPAAAGSCGADGERVRASDDREHLDRRS